MMTDRLIMFVPFLGDPIRNDRPLLKMNRKDLHCGEKMTKIVEHVPEQLMHGTGPKDCDTNARPRFRSS